MTGKAAPPRRCARYRRSIVRLDNPPSICLRLHVRRGGETGFARRTLHDTAESIENSLRREVLRGDEVDKVLLPVLLLFLRGLLAPIALQLSMVIHAPSG